MENALRKSKFIIAIFAILLAGCGQKDSTSTNSAETSALVSNDTDISTDKKIEEEIKTSILSDEYPPSEVDLVLLTSLSESTHCSIHTSWSETTSSFLAECYYSIPKVKEILNMYEYDNFEIDISSQSPSDQTRRITYKSDDDIFLLDSSESDIITQSYTYEQLNILNSSTAQEPEIVKYSDDYVSFEYDKNLFTVEKSDNDSFLSIKCPTMPDYPENGHNTVMGIDTQQHDQVSDISESEVKEFLETMAQTICQGLFKLNESEFIVSESTKYSDYCAEYYMEISDGSICYAKTINYNTYITTVILRICEYSADYNNSFMIVYDSVKSEFGNYDFNTQISETTPTLEASPESNIASTEPDLPAAPVANTSESSSASSDEKPNTQASSSSNSNVSAGNTKQNSNNPLGGNLSENKGNDNFNTYDNAEQQQTDAKYVLNTNTMKIHSPSCSSVKKIAPQNYDTSNSSVEELEAQGYSTCGICFK